MPMLIGLYIAARLNSAANSLRKLEPDMTDANDLTVAALDKALDRLYYRIHKKKIDQMLIDEQMNRKED